MPKPPLISARGHIRKCILATWPKLRNIPFYGIYEWEKMLIEDLSGSDWVPQETMSRAQRQAREKEIYIDGPHGWRTLSTDFPLNDERIVHEYFTNGISVRRYVSSLEKHWHRM